MAAALREKVIVSIGRDSVRKKPRNLVEADVRLFENEFVKKIDENHVLKLHDVLLIGDQILDFRNFRFFNSYTHPNNEPHIIKALVKSAQRLLNLVKITGKTIIIDRAIWITDNWSISYFHWVTEALTRFIAAKALINGHIIMLPSQLKKYPFVSETLVRLGFPFLFFGPDYNVKVRELLLPGHTADAGNYNPLLIDQLRTYFIGSKEVEGPFRKIFVSRRKAKNRKIANEKQVTDLLSDFGYEVHCFEDYTINKQVEIMAQAKSLIGLHGAGLTNMLFMQKKTEVLEIRNAADAHNNCFFSLASELDINYYYLLSTPTNSDSGYIEFDVDVEGLKVLLNLMLAGKSQ